MKTIKQYRQITFLFLFYLLFILSLPAFARAEQTLNDSISDDSICASGFAEEALPISEELVTLSQEGEVLGTSDTSGEITVNLFDYDAATVNAGQTLKFSSTPGSWSKTDPLSPNRWVTKSYDHQAVQGIVETTLSGEYPALTETVLDLESSESEAETLEYLFDANSEKAQSFENCTGLFSRDGNHYSFSSSENYAYLNQTTKEITLSNSNGFFTPFNTKQQTQNFFFGMSFEISFQMPEEDESETMQFSFSGDDDVWVFVDDQLMLDIGGIHGETEGTIDFSTGTVSYPYSPLSVGRTATEMNTTTSFTFEELGYAGGSFEAGTIHHLKFFYLERGANQSNCQIDFTLPVISTLQVSKEALDEEQKVLNDTTEYSFDLMLLNEITGEYYQKSEFSEAYQPVKTDQNGIRTPAEPDDDGHFKIRSGETIQFYIAEGESYYLREVNLSDSIESVRFESSHKNSETAEIVHRTASSTPVQIENSKQVYKEKIINQYKDERISFSVQKKVEESLINITEDFQFRIHFSDNPGRSYLTSIKENDGKTCQEELPVTQSVCGSETCRFEASFTLHDTESIEIRTPSSAFTLEEIKDETMMQRFETSMQIGSEVFQNGSQIQGGEVILVTNTQRYYPLKITKIISGNLAHSGQDFGFEICLSLEDQPLSNVTLYDSDQQEWTTDANGCIAFSLRGGESFELLLPEKVDYQIAEEEAEGYTTEIVRGNEAALKELEISGTTSNASTEISYTNTAELLIEGGVLSGDAPYGLYLMTGGLGAGLFTAGFQIRRRRWRK